MANYRAQVRFQGRSNLPEDVFVNTTHWQTTGTLPAADDIDIIGDRLVEFYTADVGIQNIADYMSGFIAPTAEIRIYDMAQAEPRVPIQRTFPIATAQVTGETNMPEEVAMVLSLHGSPPITPRRRGRLYLGPFTTGAVVDTGTTRVTWNGAFRTIVTGAAVRMAQLGGPVTWSIYSPTNNNYVAITGGFVDDAPDTQRRRGPRSAARTVWSAVI